MRVEVRRCLLPDASHEAFESQKIKRNFRKETTTKIEIHYFTIDLLNKEQPNQPDYPHFCLRIPQLSEIAKIMMNQARNELRMSLSSFRRVRRVLLTESSAAYHSHASSTRPTGALLPSTFSTDNQQFSSLIPPYRRFVSNSSVVHFSAAATPNKSPFAGGKPATKKKGRRKFLPPKAAVELTPKSRKFFKLLLEKPPRPDVIGKLYAATIISCADEGKAG